MKDIQFAVCVLLLREGAVLQRKNLGIHYETLRNILTL
jgi:hypothetical protein